MTIRNALTISITVDQIDFLIRYFFLFLLIFSFFSLYFFIKTAELRDQIVSVQEEKKNLAIELENLKSKLAEVMEEVCIFRPERQDFKYFRVFVDWPNLELA